MFKNNSQVNIPIFLKSPKNKGVSKKKKKDVTFEITDEDIAANGVFGFYDDNEGRTLVKGECIVGERSF